MFPFLSDGAGGSQVSVKLLERTSSAEKLRGGPLGTVHQMRNYISMGQHTRQHNTPTPEIHRLPTMCALTIFKCPNTIESGVWTFTNCKSSDYPVICVVWMEQRHINGSAV